MSTVEAGTRTEQVYRSLRADIIGGRIEPGVQLQFARLKAEYGASMGVLREALMRLTAEGLTVNQAQHGFRVFSLSMEDLVDLTSTRCIIEGLVLKDSVSNGDLDWEGRVVSAHHRLERTPQYDPDEPAAVTNAWMVAHREFHLALLSGARSQRLQGIAANLRAAAEVYRRQSTPFEQSTARNVAAEHKELAELALQRKPEEAAEALTRHLTLTQTLVIKGLGATS